MIARKGSRRPRASSLTAASALRAGQSDLTAARAAMSERPRGVSFSAVGRLKQTANRIRTRLVTRREGQGKTGERYAAGPSAVSRSGGGRSSFSAIKSGGASAFNSVKHLLGAKRSASASYAASPHFSSGTSSHVFSPRLLLPLLLLLLLLLPAHARLCPCAWPLRLPTGASARLRACQCPPPSCGAASAPACARPADLFTRPLLVRVRVADRMSPRSPASRGRRSPPAAAGRQTGRRRPCPPCRACRASTHRPGAATLEAPQGLTPALRP